MFTRRDFVKNGTAMVALGAAVPGIFRRAITAELLDRAAGAAGPGKSLVIVQMAGGNDGLNTVVPYADGTYRTLRRTLGVPDDQVLRLDDRVGLHPKLAPLKGLWDARRMAVVEGVGYPNPNLSHFTSMHIWQTASPDGTQSGGWVGKYLDSLEAKEHDPFHGFNVGGSVSPEMTSGKTSVPAVANPADGPKTIFGQSGTFTGDDVVDLILKQPATSRHIARRVWSFLAYPDPDEATLAPVAKAFTDTGGDMRAVVKSVLTHPAFFSPSAYRAIVKSPIEYAVGAVRQLSITAEARALSAWTAQMGQTPFAPPNVAGWPGGAAWMGSGTFLARLNGVNTLLFGDAPPGRLDKRAAVQPPKKPDATQNGPAAGGFDADAYLTRYKLATAGALVDHFATLLLDGQVPRDTRAALVDYASAGGGDSTSLAALPAAGRSRRVQGAVYLMMAGPEYHLA